MMLIVEDSSCFLDALRGALNLKYPSLKIDAAGSVASALMKLGDAPPDLAIMDIRLPDGSGLELAARFLALRPELPIAICTCFDLPEYREAASRIGVSAYLVKQNLDWNECTRFVDRWRQARP